MRSKAGVHLAIGIFIFCTSTSTHPFAYGRLPHGHHHSTPQALRCSCPEGFNFHDGSCHDVRGLEMQALCPTDSWYQGGRCLKKVMELSRAECPPGFSNLCGVPGLDRLSECCVRSEVVQHQPACSPPYELVEGRCTRTLTSAPLLLCPEERGDKGCIATEVQPVQAVCPVPEIDGQCIREIFQADGQPDIKKYELACPIGYSLAHEPAPDGSELPLAVCHNVSLATKKYTCEAGYRLDKQNHLCRKASRFCAFEASNTASMLIETQSRNASTIPLARRRRLGTTSASPNNSLKIDSVDSEPITTKTAVAASPMENASSLKAVAIPAAVACDENDEVKQPVGRCPSGFVSASTLDLAIYGSRLARRHAAAANLCAKVSRKPAERRCANGAKCAAVYEAVSFQHVCPTGYALLPASINWDAAEPAKNAICTMLGTAPAKPACMPGAYYDEERNTCVAVEASVPAMRCPLGFIERCMNSWNNERCECVKQHVQPHFMTNFCPPSTESREWCRYTPYGLTRFYEALCPEEHDEQACYEIEMKDDDSTCSNGVMVENKCVEATKKETPQHNQCGVVQRLESLCVQEVETQAMCPPGSRMDLTNPSRCVSAIEVAPDCSLPDAPVSEETVTETKVDASPRLE